MASKKGNAEYLRKITAKDVMGEAIKGLVKEGETVQLFVVYGIANGTKTKDTAYGPAHAVTGNFEAVRVSDGAVFQASVAYLPEPAGSTTVEAVKNKSADVDGVEFAWQVGIKASKKAATGYEFVCRPYMKPAEHQALASLRGQAAAMLTGPAG